MLFLVAPYPYTEMHYLANFKHSIDSMNKETIREAEINGIRQHYDGMSTMPTLEQAKRACPEDKFEYLGSGSKIWINGKFKGPESRTYYFFKKKIKS